MRAATSAARPDASAPPAMALDRSRAHRPGPLRAGSRHGPALNADRPRLVRACRRSADCLTPRRERRPCEPARRGNMSIDDSRYAPDSSYAWLRLAVSLLVGTAACVGTWVGRRCLAFGAGGVRDAAGRGCAPLYLRHAGLRLRQHRHGPHRRSLRHHRAGRRRGAAAGSGYILAGMAQSLWQFALAHLFLIGVGGGQASRR